ncbi:cytochrome c biogenesis protein ResB [Luteococcus sp. OSA5]|uniref:cytochrome c biogenesis protein ResB n=1 Tax=Luteococcus sp. OSA5 TaxID=3401630 RepID=UPI003B429E31
MSTAVKTPPQGLDTGPGADITPKEMLLRIYRLFYNKRIGLFLIFAMALLALVGVLFPQADAQTYNNPDWYRSFLEEQRPRYRGWTMPLSFLGVFHMFSSWPFRIVTVLLALSIIGCTTHRLPTLWKNATQPHTHVREGFFDHARTRRTVELAGSPQALFDDARTKLAAEHYRVIEDSRDDGLNLYADKHRWMPLGTALAHTAFVLILLGVLITNNTGFRNNEFTVPVGMGPQPVGHGTNLAVEAKSFTDTYHDDGSPMDYASELVLYEDGKQVKQHTTRVNSPMTYDGIAFNQAYFGFAAEVTVKDAAGKQVYHGGVPLQYSTDDKLTNFGKVEFPDKGFNMFVIAPASGQVDARIAPGQVQVEFYDRTTDEPLDKQVISQGREQQVNGLAVTLERERQFTGLMVSKDNGAILVWIGSFLLVLGTICTMFYRHQRIWLRVHRTDDGGSQVRVASPDRHDTIFEQKVFRLVDSLGKPTSPDTDDTTSSGSTHA